MKFTVAIDGPAAAGKGTISRAIAAQFGFAHLDTGTLYRGVGLAVLNGADPVQAARTLDPATLTDEVLRTAKVAQAASKVAVMQEVRDALTQFQRDFARREGGAVLDGRDIGTVICPRAEVKLFVTASAEVRATRRFRELSAKDPSLTPETVLADVKARDARDQDRSHAPMVAAPDAVRLDTSDMSIDMAVEQATTLVFKAMR